MAWDDPSRALLERLFNVLRSASEFSALAKDSETTSIAPRQSDPAVRALLDHVLNTSRLGTAASYGVEDVVVLNAWSRAAGRIGNVYLRAGSISVTNSDERVRTTDRNIVRFAPEIGRSLDTLLRLQTLTADVTAAALANESDEESLNRLILDTGWIETQSWLSTTIKSTLCFLVVDDLPQGWARDRIAVLAAVAPRAMRHLVDVDADLLRAFVEGAKSRLRDPAAKAELASIRPFASGLT